MTEVPTRRHPLERFLPIVGPEPLETASRLAASLRARLAGRRVWNVNSTAVGGGVAEMLPSLLAYARGAGIDARWIVIEGASDFFRVTKRLHHALHGSAGDGAPLDAGARAVYEATLRENAPAVAAAVRPGDVVVLHDPQTAGLAPALLRRGALVLWRSHVGHDVGDPEVAGAWAFLEPYLRNVPAFVFSRRAYVPECCDHGRTTVITPSIDAFSPKNQELDDATVRAILVRAGLVAGPPGDPAPPRDAAPVAGPPPGDAAPAFTRADGRVGLVERRAEVLRAAGPLAWETPLVVQVSRWDPLKDPVGVLRGFAALVAEGGDAGAHLVLAGPDVRAVADDPEGARVLAEVAAAWRALPEVVRGRVHLASLPVADVEENAAIVNALQRHAAVVVQKSLQEGFGLTVTEAMWKGRPVVASGVGGIQDQIESGVHGVLLRDPRDPRALAAALRRVLGDPDHARRLGARARDRVRERFLGLGHLTRYAELLLRLDGGAGRAAAVPERNS
jgi:trehalose synthase